MIIAPIHLTKKAKKACRKHQAEKAAQRLTEAVSVNDPSNELNLKALPSSPTGSQLSLTSSPDTESPSSGFSVSNVGASRSSSDLRSSSSNYSSYSKTASGVKEFEQFVRRQSNDYLHHTLEQPPSYDTVVSGSFSPQSQRAHLPTSESPSALSASSARPLLSSHPNMHAHCPTCSAILQQHQQHEHAGHPLPWRRSYHEHHPEGNASTPLRVDLPYPRYTRCQTPRSINDSVSQADQDLSSKLLTRECMRAKHQYNPQKPSKPQNCQLRFRQHSPICQSSTLTKNTRKQTRSRDSMQRESCQIDGGHMLHSCEPWAEVTMA